MHGCLKWCYYLWSCYVCTGVSVILSRIRNLFYTKTTIDYYTSTLRHFVRRSCWPTSSSKSWNSRFSSVMPSSFSASSRAFIFAYGGWEGDGRGGDHGPKHRNKSLKRAPEGGQNGRRPVQGGGDGTPPPPSLQHLPRLARCPTSASRASPHPVRKNPRNERPRPGRLRTGLVRLFPGPHSFRKGWMGGCVMKVERPKLAVLPPTHTLPSCRPFPPLSTFGLVCGFGHSSVRTNGTAVVVFVE